MHQELGFSPQSQADPNIKMDAPPSTQALALLEEIAKAGESYAQNDSGAREKLLSLAHSLAAAMELPSEAIQRIGWAEVSPI